MKPLNEILLFSTLSPYPFWAGSEKYWFDFVRDERVRERFHFHTRLADSPVTRAKGELLTAAGADVSFYKHFNVDFARRNLARLGDKIAGRETRTLPWYDEIGKGKYDLVWFNVDGLHNLRDIEYAVAICKRKNVPYWIILQHAYEDFFLTSEHEIDVITDIAASAKRFVFIAKRNRDALERSIGQRLENAFHSSNALNGEELAKAAMGAPPAPGAPARFFSLGRFSPKDKGQHLILEAFSSEKWRERGWQMSFVGPDDFGRSYIEKLTAHFGIDAGRVKCIPFADDVYSVIGEHDVLLMPSLAEGTPFAMIESMASGRPVVGTPVGGIPELIRDGETGWLARTTDVADITEALERAWLDRARWSAMGASARKFVIENNSQEKTHADLIKVLAADLD